MKVKASNGVDAYEKLLADNFHPKGHKVPPASNRARPHARGSPGPARFFPDYTAPLVRAVEANQDIAEFCRFYEERRAEELARAGT